MAESASGSSRWLKRWFIHSFFYWLSTTLSTAFHQAYAIRVLGYGVEDLGVLSFINILGVAVGSFAGLILVYRFRDKRLSFWKALTSLNLYAWSTAGFSDLLGSKLAFTLLVFTAQFAGSCGGLAYSDTIADVVSRRDSVRVFGRVGLYNSLATLLSLAYSTLVFHAAPYAEAYRVVYATAVASGAASSAFLLSLWKTTVREPVKITLRDVAARFRGVVSDERVKNYMVFIASYTFSVNLVIAVWNYYLITVFKGDEVWISVNNISYTLATITGNYVVSKLHYKLNPRKVLVASSYFIVFIPVMFLLSPTLPLQVLLNYYSGLSWAFFNNMANIYNLYIAGSDERVLVISTLGVVNNLVAATASRLGAYLGSHSLVHLQAVFIISALTRLASAVYGQRKLKPV